jgi:hypothetical protein
MNIFILDQDPTLAAKFQCDKHVVKMIVESAQMLCTVMLEQGLTFEGQYKPTHRNHPCTRWVNESMANYQWLCDHAIALCEEYTKRYGKVHKSQAIIEQCLMGNCSEEQLTPFAQAMPDQYKSNNAVQSYREYYRIEKAPIAVWAHSEAPDWF